MVYYKTKIQNNEKFMIVGKVISSASIQYKYKYVHTNLYLPDRGEFEIMILAFTWVQLAFKWIQLGLVLKQIHGALKTIHKMSFTKLYKHIYRPSVRIGFKCAQLL